MKFKKVALFLIKIFFSRIILPPVFNCNAPPKSASLFSKKQSEIVSNPDVAKYTEPAPPSNEKLNFHVKQNKLH